MLRDFNLRARRADGRHHRPTGAGKSTLVSFVCRLRAHHRAHPHRRADYRERSQLWLQSSIGYVLQEPHLFSGTVLENIRYARPDATLEEAVAAARRSTRTVSS